MDMRDVKEFIKDSLGYIIVIAIVFIIVVFIITFQVVYGSSMNPNYYNKDILLLSKISYKLFDVKNNDVIALNSEDGEVYIKRVIAGPGDDINVINNVVYVNGIELDSSYTLGKTDDFRFSDICFIEGCETGLIPDNYYFVMGDNREESLDSRNYGFGLVNKNNIIGKVIFRIFPINKFGTVI